MAAALSPQFFTFRINADKRGCLLAIEGAADIPFAIARVYFLFEAPPAARRGGHAHRNLRQAAVCLRGGCDMLLDNGEDKTAVRLDSPSRGLLIDKMIWRELFNFSPDCLLAVFADAPYDEGDYIRDYGDFLAVTGQQPY